MPVSIVRIRDRLAVLPDGSVLTSSLPDLKVEEVDGFRAQSALASTFTARLELARDGQLKLDQEAAWRAILVSRRGSRACHERLRTPPPA